MSKTVNIQITYAEREWAEIVKNAEEKGVSPAQFIRSASLSSNEFDICFKQLCERVQDLESGTRFDIKSVFGTDWLKITKGVKLSLGRNFNKLVKQNKIAVREAGKDSSNTQLYEKI